MGSQESSFDLTTLNTSSSWTTLMTHAINFEGKWMRCLLPRIRVGFMTLSYYISIGMGERP